MKLQERNIIRSRRSISRDLGTLHITRKKVNRIVDHHHTSDSILRFCTQYKLCKENIVCIDETSFVIGDCGRFGYSNRGTRINVPVSKTLRCEKYTVVMAIMSNGIFPGWLPVLVDLVIVPVIEMRVVPLFGSYSRGQIKWDTH